MSKRTRARAEPPPPSPREAELEARLVALEDYIRGILDREAPVHELRAALERAEELAGAAFERAKDAQTALAIHANAHARIDTLTLAVAEGIQHVERAENRIRATIKRARQELADGGISSPGLDAEAQQLHLLDGEGSDGGRVLPVPSSVAESVPRFDDAQPSAVPGMNRGQLRKYGGR